MNPKMEKEEKKVEQAPEKYIPGYARLGIEPIQMLTPEFPSLDSHVIQKEEEFGEFKPAISLPSNGSIDNNEYAPYAEPFVSPKEKTTPDVNDFILMLKGRIVGIGSREEMLDLTKDFLYKKEKQLSELVLLKRVSIKAGIFIDE